MAFSIYSPEQAEARLLTIQVEMAALLGINVTICNLPASPPSRWQRFKSFLGVS